MKKMNTVMMKVLMMKTMMMKTVMMKTGMMKIVMMKTAMMKMRWTAGTFPMEEPNKHIWFLNTDTRVIISVLY